MKSKLKKHIFLIIAILTFATGFFIDKNQSDIAGTDIDIDKFEIVLHQKENEYISILDSLSTAIADNTADIENTPPFTPAELANLKNKGFSFIIYKNDTLIYWSDNLFDVDKIFNPNQFVGQCTNIPDFWLDFRIKEVKNYKIIGAFRIKSKYDLKNKYLQDNFNNDLNLPNTFKISLIPLSYGIDVKSSNGEYLLSLIPNNNIFTEFKLDTFLGFIYILSFLFLVLYFNTLVNTLYKEKKGTTKIIVYIIILLIIRYLTLSLKFPLIVYSHKIFDSQFFANSSIFHSLGDLFLNLIVIILALYHFFKILSNKINNTKKNNKYISTIALFSANLLFLYGLNVIKNFILNSNIPLNLYNILNLTPYSFIDFINFSLTLFTFIAILYKVIELVYKTNDRKDFYIFNAVSAVISIIIYLVLNNDVKLHNIIALPIFILFYLFFIIKNKTKSLYFYSSIAFISALILSSILINTLNQKEQDDYGLIAVELTNENDDVAELLLGDIIPQLPTDQTLQTYAENPTLPDLENEVQKYLRRRYFKTYWNKYDISVEFCSDKLGINDKNISYCNIKYSNLYQSNGTELKWPNAYFISYNNGKTAYILSQNYYTADDTCVFYFTLSPKLYPTNIGYPELLLDENINIKPRPKYSYAKYEGNQISLKSGDYNYPLNGEKTFKPDSSLKIIKDKQYNHIIYPLSKNNYIVLTYKRITFLNSLITFSYTFLTYIILTLLILFLLNFNSIIRIKYLNFRTKLILSMLLLLTISFSMVGGITVLLNVKQFNNYHSEEVIQKLQQINISLSQSYADNDSLFYSNKTTLNSDLQELSEIFGTDINLYDSSGFLIATSRPEIYQYNLMAKRISASALFELKHNNLVQFITDEQINLLEYSSAYYQFVDKNNNLLAVINMPYFTKPDALRSEISNLIVSIINIYVVIFVLVMFLSLFISEQIISPLLILQSKFNKLELGKKYEKIEYKRKDEIGQLVHEYNLMVDKLRESINKLSKSERESAWRDMAKQIAHEIKNPLTPMKLSIQLLMRSWDNQDEDFDERIRNTSVLLINQIETLKRIAEEFSDFAKMPKPVEVPFNLADKIEEICKLYENSENVTVVPKLNGHLDATIFADEKQVARAFVNLIKNAIQAIPDGVMGKIIIDLDSYGDKIIVKIIDNGTGIPDDAKDKLFVPSFTTKSSGMGLGLAMVKNIVDNAKGKIYFKSELGKGTTFFVEFPIYKQ